MPLPRALPLLALALGTALFALPARAGLMRPVLELMRPQLESRITRACVDGLAGDNPQLAAQLQQPCRQFAEPASRCLVRETDASGKGLAVVREMMQRELGPEGERIVKRCIAQMVGLPANSLDGVSFQKLVQRFGTAQR